jgi:hypothetical protein
MSVHFDHEDVLRVSLVASRAPFGVEAGMGSHWAPRRADRDPDRPARQLIMLPTLVNPVMS